MGREAQFLMAPDLNGLFRFRLPYVFYRFSVAWKALIITAEMVFVYLTGVCWKMAASQK